MNPLKHLLSALTGGASPAAAEPAQPAVAPEWLEPISAANPCGESLEYDTDYAVLQSRLAPKADVQYGSFSAKPEAPDWVEVERDARRLLRQSKDISIFIWLARARCRLAGAAGLLEGLGTLQAVLQAFPEAVHPQLVIDGSMDPAVRANALAALCDPDGLLGDVREVVVSASTAFRLSVRDVERALAVPRPPYAAEPEGVKRQLADLHAKGDATLAALLACGACLQAIDRWSQSVLKDDAPILAPALRLLACLSSFSEPQARGTKVQADVVNAIATASLQTLELQSAHPAAPETIASAQISAATEATLPALVHHAHVLQEREHIRALLREVRQWIEHHEPSSPVSILIKQADRMWGKRFSEVAHMIPPDLMQAWDRDD